MDWFQLTAAIITSGAFSSLLTWAVTRRDRQTKQIISRTDLADKLDTLIDKKAQAEAELKAREIENHKLTGRLESNEKLLVSVIESQGAAKLKEEECQQELSSLRLELSLLRDRFAIFETANRVIGNEPST